jgi:hypothetical protein
MGGRTGTQSYKERGLLTGIVAPKSDRLDVAAAIPDLRTVGKPPASRRMPSPLKSRSSPRRPSLLRSRNQQHERRGLVCRPPVTLRAVAGLYGTRPRVRSRWARCLTE